MRARAGCVIAVAILIATVAARAADVAGGDRSIPPDEDRFINAELPDVQVTTTGGRSLSLAQIAAGRPLLLAFVFTRCTGVCSPFLASWRMSDQWLPASRAVQRVVLSFDPRDSTDDMAAFARHFDVGNDAGWTFGIVAPDDIRRVTSAAGFWYDWDESRQQFDHPAMLAAVRNGRLVRLLVGGSVSSARLDELTREASGEFVASYPLPGRVRFRCVQYDPRTGRLALDWGFALLLVPVATVSVFTTGIFAAGSHVRRRRDSRNVT
jgi:protein SCO1